MNASYTLLYIAAAMLKKKEKQCPYKPSSVFLLKIRMSVIYLVPKSPLGSSTLPSTAALRQSDEPPSICGIHELTAPRWHSLTITRQLVVSYTTFSPLLSPPHSKSKIVKAVIFFCRHLLSPIASIFGSGMPYAARTFLPHPHKGMPATDRSAAFSLQRYKKLSVTYRLEKKSHFMAKRNTY